MKRTPSFDALEVKTVMSHGLHHHHVAHHLAALAAHHAHPAQVIDSSIPFVLGSDVGAHQNAVNFTSNTFRGVLFGFEWNGIAQISARFNATGNVGQLNADITTLSHRMPFGAVNLLPVWQADLQAGSASAPAPVSTPDFGPGNGAVANILYADLIAYLNAGNGSQFNVMKSEINWPTDNLLTYNSMVAQMGSGIFPPHG